MSKAFYYCAAGVFVLWLIFKAANKTPRDLRFRLNQQASVTDLANGITFDLLKIYYPHYIRNFEDDLNISLAPERHISHMHMPTNPSAVSSRGIGSSSRKSKRKPLGERLRKLVAAGQKWQCGTCRDLLAASFEVDHIVPVCNGGTNDPKNLVALCRNCHGEKTMQDGIRLGF